MPLIFSSHTPYISIALLYIASFSHATFDINSKSNVALYWGQGSNQTRLLHFCQQSTVDIIPIGFVDLFPDQANGYPGTNFANQCWGGVYVYPGPGNNPSLDQLQSRCPQLVADIPVCQKEYGKKIILSLGGATASYQLTGTARGTYLANFLWGAFGPQTAAWVDAGLPRPFDGPDGEAVEVDGFDMDIEHPSTDNSLGYITLLKRLRTLFSTSTKNYLLTGAPQCVVPDANMGAMISQVEFDIIWVQYYNTPGCSAQDWITANPNYASTGDETSSGFSYNAWAAFLNGTASENAKLYIGVPGAPNTDGTDWFLNKTELSSLTKAYFCKPIFGGVMIWEATSSENNPDGPYYTTVKDILVGHALEESHLCTLSNTTNSSAAFPASPSIFPTRSQVSERRRSIYPPYWNATFHEKPRSSLRLRI